ncbi:MAG: LysM peptidoglycan-binding domain-containing protein [Chloroflexota bacterium]|nr:MAG: LysM peptidoglycan-binding domain-containing protein [Chloroflexota bacterium]
MTDRGMPLGDGAPACPFVAFEDDRDARATAPDHRHRCYAEVRPAPRALAHQEAYCLSSAFPVCPTFQDWARREAAHAKAAASLEADEARGADRPPLPPASDPAPPEAVEAPGSSQRNPPRSWAAPPPWLSSRDEGSEDDREVEILPPVRGGGLAGSFADRVAGGQGGLPPQTGPADRQPAPPARWADRTAATGEDDDWDDRRDRPSEPPPRARRPGRDERAPTAPALPGPSWERPRRLEAYPTLKTRLGLPSVRLPPILVGVAALALGAVALFFLPLLLGIGNDPETGGATSTPSTSAAASGSPLAPTPTPAPTQLIYVVQANDTMSTIADRFGVPLAALIEANRDAIPNPDLLQIGQEVIIPVAAPTTLPGVSPTPEPSPAG